MIFFRRLGLAELIELCRSLRYALGAGLMLRDVMDLLAKRGTRHLRTLADQIEKELKSGWSLQDALAKQEGVLTAHSSWERSSATGMRMPSGSSQSFA